MITMLSLHIVVDLHVAVNCVKVLCDVMETLEGVQFPVLLGYQIFRTADGVIFCAMF